jgi:hypothetical protein
MTGEGDSSQYYTAFSEWRVSESLRVGLEGESRRADVCTILPSEWEHLPVQTIKKTLL